MPNNQLSTLITTINESQNFASVVDGWSWRASNAGPSGSQIVDSGVGTGKCLELTGGSLGHYEELQFLGFLDPHGSYMLSYSVKADVSFATQFGDAGWYLQFFTASGETVRLLVSNAAAATTQWQTIGPIPLDCARLAATLGLNSHVIKVGLLLVNAKYTANSSPGASLYVTDILLSGTSMAQPYSYDANGNVTAAPARNLTALGYEPFRGLPSVVTLTGVEAQSVRYAYDAAGLRSAAVTDYGGGQQDKTLYLRDPLGNLIMRRQLRNGVETATSYLQCRSGLLAAHTESGEQYILTDMIGSTRAVISSTAGTPVQDYDYGPYGEVLASPAENELPYRYTGQEQDPTLGIDNYNARLYDPALRRFYAADPAGQYPSPYIYVGNNPINFKDPTGRVGLRAVTTGLRIVAWYRIALDMFSLVLNDSDFDKRFYGPLWQDLSQLSNFDPNGLIQGLIHKVLKNFSRQEAAVVAQYYPNTFPIVIPLALLRIYHPVQNAVDRAWHAGGGQQEANAIRHVVWMCNARRFGSNEFAIALGEAHELGREGTEYDEVADKINNAIGLYLAMNSAANCSELAHQALSDSILAKNSNTDPNVASAGLTPLELLEIRLSWDAGLNYLQKINSTPQLNEKNQALIKNIREWTNCLAGSSPADGSCPAK